MFLHMLLSPSWMPAFTFLPFWKPQTLTLHICKVAISAIFTVHTVYIEGTLKFTAYFQL